MPRNLEVITYRIVIGISIGLIFAAAWAVLFFGGMSTDHADQIMRLDALEHNRAKATAKRFTSDDAQDMLLCIRLKEPERCACLDRFQARFKPQE